jgi:hypothetical protein
MGKSAQIGFHVWLADAMEGKLNEKELRSRPHKKLHPATYKRTRQQTVLNTTGMCLLPLLTGYYQ